MRIKLFEEFSEWDRDEFLLDLFTMTSTEVENLFFEEIKKSKPHIEKIRVIIESGLVDVRTKNKWGQTPLHWASWKDNVEIAELLLKKGADVNAKDNRGNTPLCEVSKDNAIKTAKLLIGAGADVMISNNSLWTPLHRASQWNYVEIAELLIKAGSDLNAKNNEGDTPLHFAHYSDSHDVIDLLIEMGARRDIRNNEGLLWNEYHPDYEQEDEWDNEEDE